MNSFQYLELPRQGLNTVDNHTLWSQLKAAGDCFGPWIESGHPKPRGSKLGSMARQDDGRKDSSRNRKGDELHAPAPASVVSVPGPQGEPASAGTSASPLRVASFGLFLLRANERVLEKNGNPVKIGSRAFDILIALVERAPEVVSKRDLIGRVWGELVVDEGSLRFHIAGLRKALGDGESGARYITNVPSRGYCFAAPVSWTEAAATNVLGTDTRVPALQLPPQPTRMLGRDDVVRELTRQLRERRFVSIVGAGGIGKTTVAVGVAHQVIADFGGAIHFLDLTAIKDPQLVASALASEIGIPVVSNQPLAAILAFLRGQRLLLLLDNCEHVIEPVAALAESIFREAPQIHILATSREALRAEGEQVHHLSPLECPPHDAESLTATRAQLFPAVQLFVTQIAASGHPFELSDADAPIVAEICRRLDGIPLALDLAACRVGAYGVSGTATLLDSQFRLLWHGRRTALPRHQTLSATLDWSYELLSGTEQQTLRRLAIFVGVFSLEAALDVVGMNLGAAEIAEAIATLAEKSLVTLHSSGAMRYRLLDTTRAYALRKLIESGEHLQIARRHCEHITYALERFRATAWGPISAEGINYFVARLGDVRTALEWSFSAQGDSLHGVKLTAASAVFFLRMTVLIECMTWTERALASLEAVEQDPRLELQIQTCFALSLHSGLGATHLLHAAVARAMALAERLEDRPTQLLLLHWNWRWQCRSADFRGLAEVTARFKAVASQIGDPLAEAVAHGVVAHTFFWVGDLRESVAHARMALAVPVRSSILSAASFGYHNTIGVRNQLGRSLWTLGYPDQALAMSRGVIKDLDSVDPATFAYVIANNLFVYIFTGDWLTAEEIIDRSMSHAAKHQFSIYARITMGWQGCLAVLRDDLSRGIELLGTTLAALRAAGHQLYSPPLGSVLAEALAKAGHHELAYATVCEWSAWSEGRGNPCDLIELLRVKGEMLISMSPGDTREGEACLLNSLRLAEQQSALSLELRSGMSLARFWADQELADKALELLSPIYNRFTEGFETRDLVAAAKLLAELKSRS
jgi:predicted ATPase/DNA-binding winged helix-turn-helix (wHTH) protein